MQSPFFDAHTHVQFPPYDTDREEVLARARVAGVKMLLVGTQYSSSKAGVELAEKNPNECWAAIGFHPAHFSVNWHHDKNEQPKGEREVFDAAAMEGLARDKNVVAIGECGLDYFRIEPSDKETRKRQKEGFLAHVAIAREVKKPLMIHCRAAFPDLIELLKPLHHELKPGVIHFFSGTSDDVKKLLEMGFSFTFGGVVTFSHDYDEVIKMIPTDRVLSETDAPYVSPVPYRGKRNEPAYVVETVKKLAELKEVTVEEMAAQIWQNARRIFGL